jgi:hypothetical protein
MVGWESVEADEKRAKSEGFNKLPKMDAKVRCTMLRFRRLSDYTLLIDSPTILTSFM